VLKFEQPETQFERIVMDKIDCEIHLEWENNRFKHIFGIVIKFLFNNIKKHQNIWYSQDKK